MLFHSRPVRGVLLDMGYSENTPDLGMYQDEYIIISLVLLPAWNPD